MAGNGGDQQNQGGQPMAVPQEDHIKTLKDVFKWTMQRNWEEVVKIYKEKPYIQSAKITKSEDTILHIAVEDRTDIVEKLVAEVTDMTILEIINKSKNTALHLAAAAGKVKMCKCMVEKHPQLLTQCNRNGETPLFMAVKCGKKNVFLYLHSKCHPFHGKDYWRRKDGGSILEVAIANQHFDLAYEIIMKYKKNGNWDWDLVNNLNKKGASVLHNLASKPAAFKSGSDMGILERLVYDCIVVNQLEETTHDSILNDDPQSRHFIELPENHAKIMPFCALLRRLFHNFSFRALRRLCLWASWQSPLNQRDQENPHDVRSEPTDGGRSGSRNNQSEGRSCNNHEHQFPHTYVMRYGFFKPALGVLQFLGFIKPHKIKEEKQKHTWAVQIMKELVSRSSWWEYNGERSEPNLESPLLVAARTGVVEMVEHILHMFPIAIQDVDPKGRNALHFAAERRKYSVFMLISKRYSFDYIVKALDAWDNTPLHTAAYLPPGDILQKPWKTPSVALQMQLELKWYKIASELMPQDLLTYQNSNLQTPQQVFAETHKDMIREGANQLASMSNSCSVVAALIATVAFSTATTIPGGFGTEDGAPTFQGQTAFEVYKCFSLTALCLSIISLITYLSVLNYPSQESDFGNYLRRKLIMGFITLLLSIAFMFGTFCASHFFLLKEKHHYLAYPLYLTLCFFITLFALFQFPLYFDLMKSATTSMLPNV